MISYVYEPQILKIWCLKLLEYNSFYLSRLRNANILHNNITIIQYTTRFYKAMPMLNWLSLETLKLKYLQDNPDNLNIEINEEESVSCSQGH